MDQYMQPLLALPIFIIFLVISVALGRKLLLLLRIKSSSTVESIVFSLALGFGCFSYLVLAIGLLKVLYPAVILTAIGIIGVIVIPEIRNLYSEIVSIKKSSKNPCRSPGDFLLGFSMVCIGGMALVCALAPPTGMDWDGLAYHLAVPKLYLMHHSIYYVPFTSHSNFPFLTEMLYTIGLATHSAGVAKLFHFALYLGSAAGIYSMGSRYSGSLAGKIAALIFMTVPVVFYEAGLAYADITMGFYILLAVYSMLNWQASGMRRWLVICALMCGFALGTKVLAVVPIFAICALIVVWRARECQTADGVRLALLVGIGGAIVGSVWYVKSFVYTGNPVYPFLYNIFGGKNWSVEAAKVYQAEQSSFGMGKGFSELLFLPWNLLTEGTKFTNKQNANVFAVIGPAFLGLIPVYVLRARFNKGVLQTGIVAGVFVLSWFVLMQHSRYLIAAVPLLCVIAGAGAELGISGGKLGKWCVTGFVACVTICSIYSGAMLAALNYEPVFGMQTQPGFLSRMLDVYEAEKFINENTPQTARIVLFDEVRGFYLDRDYMWGNPNHHELIPWKSFKSGKEMVQWFRANGFTYVLWNRSFGTEQDYIRGTLFPDAEKSGLMREVYETRGRAVYELGE